MCLPTQAVEQLNIKPKSYKDLLTDEPFTRQDIIIIQVGTCIIQFCGGFQLWKVFAARKK